MNGINTSKESIIAGLNHKVDTDLINADLKNIVDNSSVNINSENKLEVNNITITTKESNLKDSVIDPNTNIIKEKYLPQNNNSSISVVESTIALHPNSTEPISISSREAFSTIPCTKIVGSKELALGINEKTGYILFLKEGRFVQYVPFSDLYSLEPIIEKITNYEQCYKLSNTYLYDLEYINNEFIIAIHMYWFADFNSSLKNLSEDIVCLKSKDGLQWEQMTDENLTSRGKHTIALDMVDTFEDFTKSILVTTTVINNEECLCAIEDGLTSTPFFYTYYINNNTWTFVEELSFKTPH